MKNVYQFSLNVINLHYGLMLLTNSAHDCNSVERHVEGRDDAC